MTLIFPKVDFSQFQIKSPNPMTPHDKDARNEGDAILGGTKVSPPMVDGTDNHVKEEIDDPTQLNDLDDAQI